MEKNSKIENVENAEIIDEINLIDAMPEDEIGDEIDVTSFLDSAPEPLSDIDAEIPIDLTKPEIEEKAEKIDREYTPPKETVKQVRAVSSATAKTFSWLLNYIVPSLCSAISGDDRERYKMSDKDQKEYDELCQYYFESTGNLPSPTIIFYIATASFVGGAFIKSFGDRKRKNNMSVPTAKKQPTQKIVNVDQSFVDTLQKRTGKRGRPKKTI